MKFLSRSVESFTKLGNRPLRSFDIFLREAWKAVRHKVRKFPLWCLESFPRKACEASSRNLENLLRGAPGKMLVKL